MTCIHDNAGQLKDESYVIKFMPTTIFC